MALDQLPIGRVPGGSMLLGTDRWWNTALLQLWWSSSARTTSSCRNSG
jgi:hypothetical protein